MPDSRTDSLPGRAPVLLVVYGTLRSGTGWRERLGVADLVESVGPCTLAGSLFELGWYPGLVLDGAGSVLAEVLRLLDPSALGAFDRFEGYDPTRPAAGEYCRVLLDVEVEGPAGPMRAEAWVYELRVAPTDRARIVGGDWLTHTEGRTSGPR